MLRWTRKCGMGSLLTIILATRVVGTFHSCGAYSSTKMRHSLKSCSKIMIQLRNMSKKFRWKGTETMVRIMMENRSKYSMIDPMTAMRILKTRNIMAVRKKLCHEKEENSREIKPRKQLLVIRNAIKMHRMDTKKGIRQ